MEEGGTPVIYELTAESAAGQRIDKYLSGQLADLSSFLSAEAVKGRRS